MKTAGRTGKAAATGIFAVALLAAPSAASAAAAQGGRDASGQTISAASADSISAKCRNNGRNYIVREYYRGVNRYTLRCGTSTWGWKHIQHRWSTSFNNKIRNTIANGERKYVPVSFSFYTLPPCSRETFRVLIGTPAAGNDIRTAYKVSSTSAAPRC
ncbi:hypothetical protein LIX60_09460 [Streptomyces sp. S07_1.15]|uniref:hypothetical protein n=1 Tax=Streptomyces sp. S07_1.15 TaxID=2873925 RepID=UPI001D15B6D7|nr:hypothetical protein [Streptomyces sp. S07_1.15]MCC3651689.1 hypothetical protein [Streptomyces sp. S07_1.15]